jgi:hypothetical protein
MTIEDAARLLSEWTKENYEFVAAKQAAVEHYGKLFHPDNIDKLTDEQFTEFLVFKNNKHWSGLNRHPEIDVDLDRLKTTLKVLLDESEPIQARLNKIADGGGSLYIRGLGKAVLTAVLMCVYPDKYAVYNRISEGALTRLGFPRPKPKDSLGNQYLHVNAYCHQIAAMIKQPLHLVDRMFSIVFRLRSENEEDAAILQFGIEGAIQLKLHRSRERNPQLVKAKKNAAMKEFGKLKCEVCGFVFSVYYGDHGSGFIECHHRRPLSRVPDAGIKVTVDDLALVCANCHRMLHWGADWLSIEQLRSRIQSGDS